MVLDNEIKDCKVLWLKTKSVLLGTILDDFKFAWDMADNNGKIAVEKLRTSTYDIILMDFTIPIMNGLKPQNTFAIN
jgi:CheY-like chemotaxis protein